jgi:hypothetical protein
MVVAEKGIDTDAVPVDPHPVVVAEEGAASGRAVADTAVAIAVED